MRYLGIKISSKGTFLPWRDDFTKNMYGIKNRLTQAGLGSLPTALVKALFGRTVPAILYGCEIWGIKWILDVLDGKASPYVHDRLNIVVNFIKQHLGLPTKSFSAAVFKLCNIPSMLALMLPRVTKFM